MARTASCSLSRPAAAKTGTTTDFRDNWTVGYTPDLVVGVWVGNADNAPMRETSGVSGAAPIWHDFMEAALKGRPAQEFERPAGLVEAEVCSLSGCLAGPDCPHRVTELFLEGTEPTAACTMHRRVYLDRATGLPATADTPFDRVVERVVTLLPPEAQEWAEEQGMAVPAWLAAALAPQDAQPAGQALAQASAPGAAAGFPGAHHEQPRFRRGLSPRSGPAPRRTADRGLGLARRELCASRRCGCWSTAGPWLGSNAPPYSTTWRLEPGLHIFSAEGVTADGDRVTSNQVRVEVRRE